MPYFIGSDHSSTPCVTLLLWAVERPTGAEEMEPAVLAVLGRTLAVAPVQLLRRVVVAGDVGALDAPHRARRLRRPAHLPQHHEPCIQRIDRLAEQEQPRTLWLGDYVLDLQLDSQLTEEEEEEGEGELHGGHGHLSS